MKKAKSIISENVFKIFKFKTKISFLKKKRKKFTSKTRMTETKQLKIKLHISDVCIFALSGRQGLKYAVSTGEG